jgi:uncharacterized protein (DUF433 family)
MSTTSQTPASWVQKTPDLCGGDACIRATRIPVWLLVRMKQLGLSDERILGDFDPPLAPADLEVAWDYYDRNREEIENNIRENEAD